MMASAVNSGVGPGAEEELGLIELLHAVRHEAQPTAALVAKTQRSEYGLLTENGVPSFLVHLDDRLIVASDDQ